MEQQNHACGHHRHHLRENQCSSTVIKHIRAPVNIVWSLVRRFDKPQEYKPFVSRCIVRGDLEIGSVREVNVKSGLPATTSTERLELLDDQEHILGVKFIGGDHRLKVPYIRILSKLLVNNHRPSGDDRRETRDTGERVVRGGCSTRKHRRRDVLLRDSFNQLQPQGFGRCLGKNGCTYQILRAVIIDHELASKKLVV